MASRSYESELTFENFQEGASEDELKTIKSVLKDILAKFAQRNIAREFPNSEVVVVCASLNLTSQTWTAEINFSTGSTDREPTLAFQQEQQNAAGDPKMLYKILVTK